LPTLDTYVRQHPDADLKLFAIDTDDQVSELKLRQLSGMVAFPLAMRFSGNAYGPIGGEVPTNYVIDRAGVVRYAQPGAFTAAAFDAVVAPLLAASPPIGRPAASST